MFDSAPSPVAKQLVVGPSGEVLVTAQAHAAGAVGVYDEGGLTVATGPNADFSLSSTGRPQVFHVDAEVWTQSEDGDIAHSPDGLTWQSAGTSSTLHLTTAFVGTDLLVASNNADALSAGLLTLEPFAVAPFDLTGTELLNVAITPDHHGWQPHTVGLVPGEGFASLVYAGPMQSGPDRLVVVNLDASGVIVERATELSDATYTAADTVRTATGQLVVPGVDAEGPHVLIFSSNPADAQRQSVDLGEAAEDVRLHELADGRLFYAATVESDDGLFNEKQVRYAISADAGQTWAPSMAVRANGGRTQRLADLAPSDSGVLMLLGDNQRLHGATGDGIMVPTLL